MSQDNVVRGVRYPVSLPSESAQRRTPDEHLFFRFPALYRLFTERVLRLPVRSRLRRLIIARSVLRAYGAANRRDFDLLILPLDPNIEMDTTRSPMHGLDRVYKGREEVAGFWVEWLEAWGEQRIEDPELIDARDRVVMWTTGHRIQGRGSGVEVSIPPYAWVMTLRDGRIVQATMYMEKEEALKAAGLSE